MTRGHFGDYKGVAQELSQDTELFPAFVESLSNMRGYATVIGEEFDKRSWNRNL